MLTGKEIIKDNHPTLRMRAQDVAMPPSEEDKATLRDIHEYIINSQKTEFTEKHGTRSGIGLAAPQINISKKMIAVHIVNKDDVPTSHAFFNPRVISHSNELTYITSGEGCLSVDEPLPGIVHRYAKIKIKAHTIDGEEIQLTFTGLASVCIQHEIDHLNGIMFYDHINKSDPFTPIEGAIAIER